MTIVEILEQSKALIATPDRWTQNALARNDKGKEVHEDDPEAVCYDAFGAVFHATSGVFPFPSERYRALAFLLQVAREKYEYDSIVYLNDHISHSDVLTVFDAAIAKARRKEELVGHANV